MRRILREAGIQGEERETALGRFDWSAYSRSLRALEGAQYRATPTNADEDAAFDGRIFDARELREIRAVLEACGHTPGSADALIESYKLDYEHRKEWREEFAARLGEVLDDAGADVFEGERQRREQVDANREIGPDDHAGDSPSLDDETFSVPRKQRERPPTAFEREFDVRPGTPFAPVTMEMFNLVPELGLSAEQFFVLLQVVTICVNEKNTTVCIDAAVYAENLLLAPSTIRRAVARLVEHGLLAKLPGGERHQTYVDIGPLRTKLAIAAAKTPGRRLSPSAEEHSERLSAIGRFLGYERSPSYFPVPLGALHTIASMSLSKPARMALVWLLRERHYGRGDSQLVRTEDFARWLGRSRVTARRALRELPESWITKSKQPKTGRWYCELLPFLEDLKDERSELRPSSRARRSQD